MNQRIRELALQAGLEMCSCGCDMPTRQSAKFAELIVRECATMTRNLSPHGELAEKAIKEHFGVKQ